MIKVKKLLLFFLYVLKEVLSTIMLIPCGYKIIQECYLKLKSIKISRYLSNKDCCTGFIFFTDSHWGANDQKSPFIIKKITNSTGINKVFFGGDFITYSDKDRDQMLLLGKDFYNHFESPDYLFFQLIGNHDNNSYDQPNKDAIISLVELEKICPIKNISSNYVKGTYYYYYDEKYIRFICLNTALEENIDSAQIEFIIKSLLCSGNRLIVVLGHKWVEWNIDEHKYFSNEKISILLTIFDAYNNRKKYKEADFKKCEGRIILLIGGHIHNNFIKYTLSGIPVVICDSDCRSKTYSNKVPTISNTVDDYSVSVFIIDNSKRLINIVNVGRGKSRKIKI